MTICKLSPLFQDEQLDNNGLPLSGGKVYWYLSGTSTPVTTYTEITGTVPQSFPIILNSRGEPPQPIWLTTGQAYKAALYDSLGNLIRTIDNITGINDFPATPAASEWLLFATAPTYISATSFSVAGDQTAIFTTSRRVKIPVGSGTDYASVSTATYSSGTGRTTVVIVNDSTVLDASISTVYYSILDPAHPSIDLTAVNIGTKLALQNQTYTRIVCTGTATATNGTYTGIADPAITAYADGMRFSCTFSVSGGTTTNMLSLNGLASTVLLQYYGDLTLGHAEIITSHNYDIVYQAGYFYVLNPIAYDYTKFVSKTGFETITGIKTFQTGAEPKAQNIPHAWACMDGYTSPALAYTVASEIVTVTTTADALSNAKIPGSKVYLLASTGTLPIGTYDVDTVGGSTFTCRAPAGTPNTSGNLTIAGWAKDHYGINTFVKSASGDFTFTFDSVFSNIFYSVYGGMNSTDGSVTVYGSASANPTLKTTTQCRIQTNNAAGTNANFREFYVNFIGK